MPSEPWVIHDFQRPTRGLGCQRCGRLEENLNFHYPPPNKPSKDVNKILEDGTLEDDHIVRGDA